MIAAGAQLFQRKGYHGTGLTELLEASKAPKGSFYHHFPEGKEQLAEAAMAQARDAVNARIEAAFADATSFADGALALADAIGDWFERSGYAEGCPITSVLLETVPGSDRLAAASAAAFADWIARAESHTRRLGDVCDPHVAATSLLIALEGAWIVARAQRSREPFKIAARMVLAVSSSE
jgi:TetR/AcrR family transcriptional repressor of lmrAB and yxaGH operons